MLDASAIEKEGNIGGFETLGIDSETIPPLLNWDRPPVHIPGGRLASFRNHCLKQGISVGEVDQIISRLRYIDEEKTDRAFGGLFSWFQRKIGESTFFLVTYEEEKSSGSWVSQKLIERGLANCVGGKPISVRKFIEGFQQGEIPPGVNVAIADDLMIFGEQIACHIIEPIIKACKFKPGQFFVGVLGSTNIARRNGFTGNLFDGVNLARIFQIPVIEEEGLTNPFGSNNYYILTFFHHRVSDRVLPPLLRSGQYFVENCRHYWLIDNLCIPPPYDPDRFTTGSWSTMAKEIPRVE